MKSLEKILKEFEDNYNTKVLYVTLDGFKLFGTDSIDSDTDYKGIFIPNKRDILLKRDIVSKNKKDDVDLQLYSIYNDLVC